MPTWVRAPTSQAPGRARRSRWSRDRTSEGRGRRVIGRGTGDGIEHGSARPSASTSASPARPVLVGGRHRPASELRHRCTSAAVSSFARCARPSRAQADVSARFELRHARLRCHVMRRAVHPHVRWRRSRHSGDHDERRHGLHRRAEQADRRPACPAHWRRRGGAGTTARFDDLRLRRCIIWRGDDFRERATLRDGRPSRRARAGVATLQQKLSAPGSSGWRDPGPCSLHPVGSPSSGERSLVGAAPERLEDSARPRRVT